MQRFSIFLNILCLGLTLTRPGVGQNKTEKARYLFDEGVAALEEHNYAVALEVFRKAYDTRPHWMILAHIGTCYAKINEPVKAIQTLAKYLKEGGNKIPNDERLAARVMMESQGEKVGVLRLIIKEKGVSVTVDGDSIGKSPHGHVTLKVGPHHINAVFGKNRIEERDIEITAGTVLEIIVFEDDPLEKTAAVLETPSQKIKTVPLLYKESDSLTSNPQKKSLDVEFPSGKAASDNKESLDANGVSTPFFVALGFAGVGAITGGIGWGLYAKNIASEKNYAKKLEKSIYDNYDWKTTCQEGSGEVVRLDDENQLNYCLTEQDRQKYEQKTNAFLAVGIIGTGAAVIGSGLTLLFYFHPEWFKTSKEKMTLSFAPMVSPTERGLVFSTRF